MSVSVALEENEKQTTDEILRGIEPKNIRRILNSDNIGQLALALSSNLPLPENCETMIPLYRHTWKPRSYFSEDDIGVAKGYLWNGD